MRVLVTGSRNWGDMDAIGEALLAVQYDPAAFGVTRPIGTERMVLIHGAARGADRIAERWAIIWGWQREAYPADWDTWGKAAGSMRNQQMVASNPDICVAFPLGESKGTRDCIRRARRAGIPVVVKEGVPV